MRKYQTWKCLYFDINGNSITARVDPKTTIKTGDTAEIALDIHKIHFFDKETSKTIINQERLDDLKVKF